MELLYNAKDHNSIILVVGGDNGRLEKRHKVSTLILSGHAPPVVELRKLIKKAESEGYPVEELITTSMDKVVEYLKRGYTWDIPQTTSQKEKQMKAEAKRYEPKAVIGCPHRGNCAEEGFLCQSCDNNPDKKESHYKPNRHPFGVGK
jgi:hypothetical protein